MGASDRAVEVVVDRVKGYLYPSAAEKAAAYELFVACNASATCQPLIDGGGTIRRHLDALDALGATIVEVLRRGGIATAKGSAGNLSLSVVALRVVSEVIRPVQLRWDTELAAHEARYRAATPDTDQVACEAAWPHATLCREQLHAVRRSLRDAQYELLRIAGLPGDAFQTNPPAALIQHEKVDALPHAPEGAVPRPEMVRWLAITELWRAWRATRRGRTPVSRPSHEVPQLTFAGPRRDAHDFVFDYVADLGDGFDPTMAVAWHVGRRHLRLPADPEQDLPTPPTQLRRADLLVLGGDEVYPFATADGYRDRTVLPYALAWEGDPPTDGEPWPDALAIPGNHDWMGGIHHFDDVFVHGETFAGHWRSRQTTRHWSVELPHGWWLWGVDTGLDDVLPDEQAMQLRAAALKRGDRVIVCTPVPLWQLRQRKPDAYHALRGTLDAAVTEKGASIPLFVAGDSHLCAHYERVGGRSPESHVTAGGGGAFLQPTHNLPDRIPLEKGNVEFRRTVVWPPAAESHALAGGVGALRDGRLWLWFVVAALVHLAYAALLAIDVGRITWLKGDATPAYQKALGWALSSPWAWPLLVVVVAGGALSVKPNSREARLRSAGRNLGALAGAALAATLVVVAAARWWRWHRSPGIWPLVLSCLVGGATTTAAFFWLARWVNGRIRANDALTFSAAHLTRFKHFLRFVIDRRGDLTCYVIGLDPVGEGWWRALHERKLVPPPDKAGLPHLHYVWGRRFAKTDHPIKVTLSISRPGGANADTEVDRALEATFRLLCHRLLDAGHYVLYGGTPDFDFTAELVEVERKRHEGDHRAERRLVNYVADYQWRPELADETAPLSAVHVGRGAIDGESDVDRIACDLTAMRTRLTQDAALRVCIGGDLTPGSPGTRRAPGVVEEAALSVEAGKPLILVGGFGGASGLLADAMLDAVDASRLSELTTHFVAPHSTEAPPFRAMLARFGSTTQLANTLTADQNHRLLTSTDPDTIVDLVMRSVRNLADEVRRGSG